jgi:hypothetical protein
MEFSPSCLEDWLAEGHTLESLQEFNAMIEQESPCKLVPAGLAITNFCVPNENFDDICNCLHLCLISTPFYSLCYNESEYSYTVVQILPSGYSRTDIVSVFWDPMQEAYVIEVRKIDGDLTFFTTEEDRSFYIHVYDLVFELFHEEETLSIREKVMVGIHEDMIGSSIDLATGTPTAVTVAWSPYLHSSAHLS